MNLADKFEVIKLFLKTPSKSIEDVFKSLNPANKITLNFTQIQNVINSIESLIEDEVLILKDGELCLYFKN